jgi:hypothetical protein
VLRPSTEFVSLIRKSLVLSRHSSRFLPIRKTHNSLQFCQEQKHHGLIRSLTKKHLFYESKLVGHQRTSVLLKHQKPLCTRVLRLFHPVFILTTPGWLNGKQINWQKQFRSVASTKQKCFYFSFRLQASGSQFIQVLKSNDLQRIKQDERISFDPSSIPPTHGAVTQIGDILLKDATSTHRGHYLDYLRSEILPKDTPPFDLKIRHKDPSGVKSQILTVHCGKHVATRVAQILSSALNGEGMNPEIFIYRLALRANRITRGDHEQIYQIHHDFIANITHLPFLSSKQIDTPIVEYLETGEQISRTPRQWVKSLCNGEGASLEVDLENGLPHGDAILIVLSVYLEQASIELNKYWQRQNLCS